MPGGHAGVLDRLGAAPLPPALQEIADASPSLAPLLADVVVLARSHAPVLISGETGAGKELLARAVHYLSPRAGQPWVPVNCGALPAELVESEFFGHVRGAFTGASQTRGGLVHAARGGTLFLDEVDALPLKAQAALLRFLQDRRFRPVGGDRSVSADVRIVAASNGALEALVQRGAFRKDLYYRLKVLTLDLPPLRARRADIRPLAMHFVERTCTEYQVEAVHLSDAAWQALHAHDWPGNVRELEHTIERAVLLCRDHQVEAADLGLPAPTHVSGGGPDAARRAQQLALSADSFRQAKQQLIDEFECHYLDQLLLLHHGNVSRAAAAARKHRRALWELLRKHAIDPARYR
jgi:DNA-binding NtrC family response regulator